MFIRAFVSSNSITSRGPERCRKERLTMDVWLFYRRHRSLVSNLEDSRSPGHDGGGQAIDTHRALIDTNWSLKQAFSFRLKKHADVYNWSKLFFVLTSTQISCNVDFKARFAFFPKITVGVNLVFKNTYWKDYSWKYSPGYWKNWHKPRDAVVSSINPSYDWTRGEPCHSYYCLL